MLKLMLSSFFFTLSAEVCRIKGSCGNQYTLRRRRSMCYRTPHVTNRIPLRFPKLESIKTHLCFINAVVVSMNGHEPPVILPGTNREGWLGNPLGRETPESHRNLNNCFFFEGFTNSPVQVKSGDLRVVPLEVREVEEVRRGFLLSSLPERQRLRKRLTWSQQDRFQSRPFISEPWIRVPRRQMIRKNISTFISAINSRRSLRIGGWRVNSYHPPLENPLISNGMIL